METESLIQATFSKFGIGVDFSALQEGCIAGILAWTNPRDACRMSTISPEFLWATESDALWKMFLPTNYREIMGRSSESSAQLDLSSKNEVFFFFSDSAILFAWPTRVKKVFGWTKKVERSVADKDNYVDYIHLIQELSRKRLNGMKF